MVLNLGQEVVPTEKRVNRSERNFEILFLCCFDDRGVGWRLHVAHARDQCLKDHGILVLEASEVVFGSSARFLQSCEHRFQHAS